jgi:1,4-dihydroxy-2-naphthoyl-CoA synthase
MLRAEAHAMGRAFAAKPRSAMRLARAAFMRANDDRRAIAEAVANFCEVAATAEAQEGVRAFIEKRAPNW